MNIIIKEAVNLRTVLLLMVKLVENKEPSMLIAPIMVAMQSFAVTIKGKVILMKVATSRIPHHLGSGLLSPRVICRYHNKQTAFNS